MLLSVRMAVTIIPFYENALLSSFIEALVLAELSFVFVREIISPFSGIELLLINTFFPTKPSAL